MGFNTVEISTIEPELSIPTGKGLSVTGIGLSVLSVAAAAGGSFHMLTTKVDVTPGTDADWITVTATDHAVPTGATGVILHYQQTAAGTLDMGARKKGSSDARVSPPYTTDPHFMVMIGLGTAGDLDKFELYVEDKTKQKFEIIGYTTAGVTFLTNGADKSTATTGSFENVDVSSECPNAIGVIIEYVGTGWQKLALRKEGSADDRSNYCYGHGWAIVGCDASQIFEQKIDNAALDIFIVGYVTTGATFLTNATDLSTATTGSWVDLTTLPSGAAIAFVEIYNTGAGGPFNYGLRKDGSSENIYTDVCWHCWLIVEAASNIIEGEIEDAAVDFFLVGHAE